MLVRVIKYIGHSSTRTFEGTKIVYLQFSWYWLYQIFHYIVITYIVLKIIVEYYTYNINSKLLFVKFY